MVRAWLGVAVHARHVVPDFQFVQMQTPELAGPEWELEFVDYLYLSFTNATAFGWSSHRRVG